MYVEEDKSMQIALKVFFSSPLCILHIYMTRSITIYVNSFLHIWLLELLHRCYYYLHTLIKLVSIYIYNKT